MHKKSGFPVKGILRNYTSHIITFPPVKPHVDKNATSSLGCKRGGVSIPQNTEFIEGTFSSCAIK